MKYPTLLISLLCMLLFAACSEDEADDCTLSLRIDTVQAARCGQPDGSITLVPILDGGGSVMYRLNDEAFQTSTTFETLPPGPYTITARNETGCTTTTVVTVAEREAALSAVATTTSSPCSASEGNVALEISGGTAPYTYLLNDTVSSDIPSFSNLPPGQYHLTARDAEGCTTNVEATVTSGVSFEATIREMITTTCAVTGCHVGQRVPNFSTEEDIFEYASRIQERTSEGSMPPPDSGRSLTAEQIEQIACWVNDGAPNN